MVSASSSGRPLPGPARLTGAHPLPFLPDLKPFEARVLGASSGTEGPPLGMLPAPGGNR